MITLGIDTFICIVGGSFIVGGGSGAYSYSLPKCWT